jgi:hypothetical protein
MNRYKVNVAFKPKGKMKEMQSTKEIVMSYIGALDQHQYETAARLIDDDVKIIGPAGEGFGGPKPFIEMMQKFPGKYDIKRTFVDGDEVSLLYDFVMEEVTVYMSSWYRVRNGKIVFIRTIFDPNAFDRPHEKR